jgi:glycosyltransferase involved in cell wall biosynthesis
MSDVCLVIPCYNEAQRLDGAEIVSYLNRRPSLRVCLVDDGSTDNTRQVIEALRRERPRQIDVLGLAKNSGKAEAVRRGVQHVAATTDVPLIGYWDADLSTPFAELERLLRALESSDVCVLAIGSRWKHLGAHIDRRALRHVLGRLFAIATSWLLEMPVYDSQCGAKVFRARLVPILFGQPFISPWLFDVELLARLKNHLGTDLALRAVSEVPLAAWIEVGGSKLRPSSMARVPRDLWKIAKTYRLRLPGGERRRR